mgnify:CR=1 FL=1
MDVSGWILSVLLGLEIIVPDPSDPSRIVVEATGVSEDAKLSLHLLDEAGESGSAMFGKVESADGNLRFRPAFALTRGASYEAILRSEKGIDLTKKFTIAKPDALPPKLVKTYPTNAGIPANLLKFYLYFDQPMRETQAIFDRIHLEDSDGNRVHAPWRRQLLWTDDSKRLTLWIHPGRIKRGVNLREEFGPVLQPNRAYALVIEADVQAASGATLGEQVRLEFRTGDEDFERRHWHSRSPRG